MQQCPKMHKAMKCSCADGATLYFQTGFGKYSWVFDFSGKLVTLEVQSDYLVGICRGYELYGPVVDCPEPATCTGLCAT